jgi:hypothetical protein
MYAAPKSEVAVYLAVPPDLFCVRELLLVGVGRCDHYADELSGGDGATAELSSVASAGSPQPNNPANAGLPGLQPSPLRSLGQRSMKYHESGQPRRVPYFISCVNYRKTVKRPTLGYAGSGLSGVRCRGPGAWPGRILLLVSGPVWGKYGQRARNAIKNSSPLGVEASGTLTRTGHVTVLIGCPARYSFSAKSQVCPFTPGVRCGQWTPCAGTADRSCASP